MRGRRRARPPRSLRGASRRTSGDSRRATCQLTVSVPAAVKTPPGLISWTEQAPAAPAGTVASILSSVWATIVALILQMRTSVAASRLQVENIVMVLPTLATVGAKLSRHAHRAPASSDGGGAQQKARLFESPLMVSAKKRPVRLLSCPSCIVRWGAQKYPLIAVCLPKLK